MTSTEALDAERMEDRLDQFLDPVLSFRRSATGPAKQMATLNNKEQQFGLHWVEVIAATNAEMAYQFAAHFADAVAALQHNLNAVEHWIIDAMSAFDERGLQLAIKVLHNTREFAETYFKKQQGIALDDIKKLLTSFVCGLNGRALKIESAELNYTDTETIFLPELIAHYPSKQENFLYYKLLTVYLWAQNWFGSWRYDLNEIVNEYDDPVRALKLFHSFESIRLLYCIRHELPGFYRQTDAFLEQLKILESNNEWQEIIELLAQKKSTIDDTLKLLKQYYQQSDICDFHFQGVLGTSIK